MKAEIKYFHSPDIENLESFSPKLADNFCFLLQVFVGRKGVEGEESFDMLVCTPKWLMENNKEDSIIFGHHYLIVFKYNFNSISNSLNRYIESMNGENWVKIVEKIRQVGKWEFEDYREF